MSLTNKIHVYYYYMKTFFRKRFTVLNMFIKREKRLYYLYYSREVVEVTAANYLKIVKIDAVEFAFLELTNYRGEKSWCRAERF